MTDNLRGLQYAHAHQNAERYFCTHVDLQMIDDKNRYAGANQVSEGIKAL